jgi:hypothetical protein
MHSGQFSTQLRILALMHASSNLRLKPQRPSYIKFEALVSLCLLLIVGGVFYRSEQLRSKFRILGEISIAAQKSKGTDSEYVTVAHSRLLREIAEFNAKAAAVGLTAKQIFIHDESSSSVHMASGSRNLPRAASDMISYGLPPSTAASRQDSNCACEKSPADSAWPMRPAAEVAKENPELAAALKRSAKNNEVMLALANGIMMCKNSSICW